MAGGDRYRGAAALAFAVPWLPVAAVFSGGASGHRAEPLATDAEVVCFEDPQTWVFNGWIQSFVLASARPSDLGSVVQLPAAVRWSAGDRCRWAQSAGCQPRQPGLVAVAFWTNLLTPHRAEFRRLFGEGELMPGMKGTLLPVQVDARFC